MGEGANKSTNCILAHPYLGPTAVATASIVIFYSPVMVETTQEARTAPVVKLTLTLTLILPGLRE